MKVLPPNQEIKLYEEGFGANDLLERKKVGEALSDLVDRIEDPLVIALDGNWGTGKTHFLKRWVGAHTKENGSKATTVYFDAFSHDYLNDPLPALVSALTDRLPGNNKAKIERVKKAAFKLVKPLARIGLAVATFGATEALNEFGDAAIEAVSDESADALEKYWKEETGRREAMFEFRNALEALAEASLEDSDGSSLVFVIDELDRCRPDYALEVLEVIKHFFSVPHVHFILGVNLKALENSVHARYGENTDGYAYLKKFIQLTLELPDKVGNEYNRQSANFVYLSYLINEFSIPKHIAQPLKEEMSVFALYSSFSMRDVEKIISSISLASRDVIQNSNVLNGWIRIMLDLIITKIIRPDLYPKLLNSSITDNELSSYLGVKTVVTTQAERQILWKYLTWSFIINDGQLPDSYKDHKESIAHQFDRYGFDIDAIRIPRQVHTKWLEQFKLYGS